MLRDGRWVLLESPVRVARGELVRHRRYGYRGVVVAFDLQCEAPDDWYKQNRTQPKKNQPWYHVLVDGQEHTTYVAERHLAGEPVPAPIRHPLLDRYFTGFNGSAYERRGTVA